MPTNQELRHAAARAISGTARDYNSDMLAAFAVSGITSGTYNERLLMWINAVLGSTHTSIPAAMQAFAQDQGFNNWDSMGTFETIPSWVLSVSGVAATLDTDFVNNRAYNANETTVATLLSCSRASSGYYTKADGTLQNFSSNTLRYGTNGLLVENASTNINIRSQELSNATWSKLNCSVTADAIAAPDGTTTADLIVGSTSAALHATYNSAGAAIATVSQAYTMSFYAKAGGYSYLAIQIDGLSGHIGGVVVYGLSGAGTTTIGSGITSASITSIANGWYYCTVTATATGTNCGPIFGPRSSAGSTFDSGAQDGTSGIYVWGVQVEQGTAATSYIPTTTASATRAADVITFSDLTWFDGAATTIYAEWLAKNIAAAKVWSLDATNDTFLDEQSGMSARINDAAATFAVTVATTATAGATVKAAARLAANDIAICMNGGTVATDTTATAPGTLTASRLGIDLSSANALNGYIRRVAAFKSTLLSNANLQSLTT